MITSFREKYDFLSNFYPAKIMYDSVFYPCSENAFQAAKTLDPTEKQQFTYLAPGKAKKAGGQLNLRPNWEDIKVDIMLEIVRAKFTQNAELKKRLLNTADEELIEGNTWHDNFWGVCECPECGGMKGKNTLGKILMQVRKELKQQTGNGS
jgi:ribA/ribD-fused uncharacterized protein